MVTFLIWPMASGPIVSSQPFKSHVFSSIVKAVSEQKKWLGLVAHGSADLQVCPEIADSLASGREMAMIDTSILIFRLIWKSE